MEKITVLIPVFNSEATIGTVSSELIQVFSDKMNFRLVLVNDGSTDGSDHICEQLCRDNPGTVTYVELSRNFGEHNAIMAGLHHVSGDYCIIMDDDMQNPPEEARKLINEILKGYDVVYTHYEEKHHSLVRRLGSYFNDRVATIVMNKPSGLYLSSFKIINRFLINEIIKFDGQDPYIDGIILRSTNRIGSVLAQHRPRNHGHSGYTLRKLVSLWGSMAMNFSLIPLRMIGIFGAILTICSAVFGIHRRYFYPPDGALTDIEWIMIVMLLLVGLVFFSIALLAEYVGRMYLFMHKEPQYIVREVISPENAQ